MENIKPNIFSYATSELSQDAFYLWLCEWANKSYASINISLHNCAKDFIKDVLCKDNSGKCLLEEEIETVKTFKQQYKVDVSLLVNDKYFIIIEDKTYTSEHSGQLERYKNAAEKHCLENKYEKLICVYLKNTFQSQASLKTMIENSWTPVMRKNLVEFFKKYESVKNDILSDYIKHLFVINDNIISFKTKDIKEWTDSNWIGFYEELEEEFEKRNLPAVVGWGYNATPSGGFWGLYWHWVILEKNVGGAIYLQIEQPKLCIRLDVAGENQENRDKIIPKVINIIKEKSNEDKYKNDLFISQSYLRVAKSGYMTIAHTEATNWLGTGEFCMDKVIERLMKYMDFIKECSK